MIYQTPEVAALMVARCVLIGRKMKPRMVWKCVAPDFLKSFPDSRTERTDTEALAVPHLTSERS